MQYVATIKKKSPMHQLWRKNAPKNSAHKVRFLDTLFIFDKVSGEYTASGELPHIGRLMRHPHVNVDIMTQPVGEVTPILPPEAVMEADAEAPEAPESSEESPAPEADIETDTEETEVVEKTTEE